jgi:hypothetical protein
MSIVANEIIPKCTTPVFLTAVLIKGDDLREVDWQIVIEVSNKRSASFSGFRSSKILTSDLEYRNTFYNTNKMAPR